MTEPIETKHYPVLPLIIFVNLHLLLEHCHLE